MQHITVAIALLAATALPSLAAETDEIAGLVGPAAPVGLSIQEKGALALGREYPDDDLLATRALRSRILVLEPGGVVPIHSHADRPAITYILEGEVIEHRSDSAEPIVRQRGDVTFDGDGLAQWWSNETDERVVFYVVDLFDTGSTPDH
ncbi:MAG: cupin domain-containing protein [Pseudomonadota bacterium]